MNKRQLTDYRRDDVGFVFQFYNLVGNLTALENVELANQISKHPLDAKKVLMDVGLGDRTHHRLSLCLGIGYTHRYYGRHWQGSGTGYLD